MKKLLLALSVIFSVVVLSGCATGGPTTPPQGRTIGYSNYPGYTVGYGYSDRDDDTGVGTYRGYGGWASSYYDPGYRGGFYR